MDLTSRYLNFLIVHLADQRESVKYFNGSLPFPAVIEVSIEQYDMVDLILFAQVPKSNVLADLYILKGFRTFINLLYMNSQSTVFSLFSD